MKRKVFWAAVIGILILVVIVSVSWYIEVRTRQTDSNWQIANEIYRVENALKEVNEDYECQSVSKATPFTYTDFEGNTIVRFCFQIAYISSGSREHTESNADEHDYLRCSLWINILLALNMLKDIPRNNI